MVIGEREGPDGARAGNKSNKQGLSQDFNTIIGSLEPVAPDMSLLLLRSCSAALAALVATASRACPGQASANEITTWMRHAV
jgi:hypothetical protein